MKPYLHYFFLKEVERSFELRTIGLAELLGINKKQLLELKENLKNGISILQEHQQEHLYQLYLAAKKFEQNGLVANYSIKHHLIGGETEFIEGLSKNPLWAVDKLIEVLERGKKQKEWLEKLLKDRAPKQDIEDIL